MTKRADQLLREAAKYLASAEQKQAKADADKWAAAERMWKANAEEGTSKREIARKLAISDRSVRIYVEVWGAYRGTHSFTDAYYAAKGADAGDREEQAVERVLRERPHVVAEKIAQRPEAARAIAEHKPARQALSRAADDHYAAVKAESEERFAESVGHDTAAGLAQEQRLRDGESKLFEARRALRDALVMFNSSDLDAMHDAWREDLLKTLDDLAMRIDVARSLLGGTLDEDIERFLSEV